MFLSYQWICIIYKSSNDYLEMLSTFSVEFGDHRVYDYIRCRFLDTNIHRNNNLSDSEFLGLLDGDFVTIDELGHCDIHFVEWFRL